MNRLLLSKRLIPKMALTKYQYVKSFEEFDRIVPEQWVILNYKLLNKDDIYHAKGIIKSDNLHNLMSNAATSVIEDYNSLSLAYGYANSFNFILHKSSSLYKRRASKLLTVVGSSFTSNICKNWTDFIPCELSMATLIEGFIYTLPSDQSLRDYLTLQQLNCHYNNLEETVVNNLCKSNINLQEARKKACEMNVSQKNEILFLTYGINYNNEPVKYKKGTIIIKDKDKITTMSKDMHKNEFWVDDYLLENQTRHSAFQQYVQFCKKESQILPHCWIVVRIDGKSFHKFSDTHNFTKPNDERSLRLFNTVAKAVLETFPKCIMAYGQSDEYSFVINKYFHGQKEKYSVMSKVVSIFTSSFISNWSKYFDFELSYLPAFDARVVIYPSNACLRDYLCWRQVDCHINNLYNTCFWKLIQLKNMTPNEAQEYLSTTVSKQKLKILKNELSIDYYNEDSIFRKGTVFYVNENNQFTEENCDIISNEFWDKRPWLLVEEFRAGASCDKDVENFLLENGVGSK